MKNTIHGADRGASIAEYSIIAGLVSAVAIGAVASLGGMTSDTFDSASRELWLIPGLGTQEDRLPEKSSGSRLFYKDFSQRRKLVGRGRFVPQQQSAKFAKGAFGFVPNGQWACSLTPVSPSAKVLVRTLKSVSMIS